MKAILLMVTLATGLAASESRRFCGRAMAHSAHAFYQYFQALQKERLNPVERVVFSLVLTNESVHHDTCPPVHL